MPAPSSFPFFLLLYYNCPVCNIVLFIYPIIKLAQDLSHRNAPLVFAISGKNTRPDENPSLLRGFLFSLKDKFPVAADGDPASGRR